MHNLLTVTFLIINFIFKTYLFRLPQLMLSLHIRMSGAETHGPVDQVEHQEHDGEHHKEHIIHLVKIMSKLMDRSSGS
jgi:hypothetical protein